MKYRGTSNRKGKTCIVSEGSCPTVFGRLREREHMLTIHLKDIEFDVFCVAPTSEAANAKYNVDEKAERFLDLYREPAK